MRPENFPEGNSEFSITNLSLELSKPCIKALQPCQPTLVPEKGCHEGTSDASHLQNGDASTQSTNQLAAYRLAPFLLVDLLFNYLVVLLNVLLKGSSQHPHYIHHLLSKGCITCGLEAYSHLFRLDHLGLAIIVYVARELPSCCIREHTCRTDLEVNIF